jgi:hypothetical protein
MELSTDAAVGTAEMTVPAAPGTPAGSMALAASGSFGTAESAPSAWALVAAGPGVATVRVTVAGATDQMAPADGLAVVALPGLADLGGDTIDALDATGNVLSSVTVPAAGSVPTPIECAPTTTTTTPTPTTTTGPPTTGTVTPTTGTVPPATVLPPVKGAPSGASGSAGAARPTAGQVADRPADGAAVL